MMVRILKVIPARNAAMQTDTTGAVQHVKAAEARLADINALLADWAACAIEESAPLVERLEALGYAVRGKSHDEVVEVLKHPPARQVGDGAQPVAP